MKSRAHVIVDFAPKTFGGRSIPQQIRESGSDAPVRFVQYFNERVHDAPMQRKHAVAIVDFCAWADEQQYNFWTFRPLLISFYLQQLNFAGTPMPVIRQSWEAIKILFDWLHSLRLVPANFAASVPDPQSGFLSETECVDGVPAIDISAVVLPA